MSQLAFVPPEDAYGITPSSQPLDGQQISSLYAVLAYITHNRQAKKDAAQALLEQKYGVDSIAKISRHDYQQAVEFLIDLRMDDIRSRK